MIRSEESKQAWQEAARVGDWETVDAIEAEWQSLLIEPESQIDWDSEPYSDLDEWATEELPWTKEDEAGLEEYEEAKRARIAEANEY